MSFGQDMKDFVTGFKAGSDFVQDVEKGKREERRLDILDRNSQTEEGYKDWYMRAQEAKNAGFDSPEQYEEYKRTFPGGGGGTGGSEAPPDLTGNEVYSGFMDTVKTEVQNPYALAVIASTGKRESGFSPGNANRVWNDGKNNAGGIMSWNGPRLANLQRANGGRNGTPQQQGQFFLKENPALIKKLNGAKSLEEAQQIMNNAWGFKGYNQPNHPETVARLRASRGFLPTFQEGAGGGKIAAAVTKPAIPEPETPAQPTEPDVITVPPRSDQVPVPEDRPQQTSFLLPEEEEDQWGTFHAATGGVIPEPEYFADGGPVDKYSPTRAYTQPIAQTPTSDFVPRRISTPAVTPTAGGMNPIPAGTGYGMGQVTPMQQRLRDTRAASAARVQQQAAAKAAAQQAAAAQAAAQQKAAADAAARAQADKDAKRKQLQEQRRGGGSGRSHQGYGSMGEGREGGRYGGSFHFEEGGAIPMNFAEGGRVADDPPPEVVDWLVKNVVDENSPVGRTIREKWEEGAGDRAKGDRVRPQAPDPSRFGPDLGIAKPGSPMARQIERMNAPQPSPDTAATRASKAEPRQTESRHRPPSPPTQGPSSDKGAIPDTVATRTSKDVGEGEQKAAMERLKLRNEDYRSLPTPTPKPQQGPPVDPAASTRRPAQPPEQAPGTHRPPTGPEPVLPQQGPEYIPPEQTGPNVASAVNPGAIPEPEARPSTVVETPIAPPPPQGISRANLPRDPGDVTPVRRVDTEQPQTMSRAGVPLETPTAPVAGTRSSPGVVEARPSNAIQTPMTPSPEPVIPTPEPAVAEVAPEVQPETPPDTTGAIATPEDPTLPSGPEAPVPGERPATNLEKGTPLLLKKEDVAEVKKACGQVLSDALHKPEGAVATPEDDTQAKVKADRLVRNADAATHEQVQQIYSVVDPDNKLSEEERLIKSIMDQRDWFLAKGLPDKARDATLAIASYSRKMSQRYGALAQVAIDKGDLDGAAKWMKRAYANIPDGRSLQYTKSTDGKSFEWKVVDDTSGDIVDSGTATADNMRDMTHALMDGSGWISMMSQNLDSKGTGKQSSIQERQNLNAEQQELFADSVEALKAAKANPDDEELQRKADQAYNAYASSIGPKDEKDLARPYIDAGVEPPPGLKQAEKGGKGTAKERAAAEDKKFYEDRYNAAEAESDAKKKTGIYGEMLQHAWDGAKDRPVKDDQVETAVSEVTDDDEAVQQQKQDIYRNLVEQLTMKNPMSASMAKRAIDYMSDPSKSGGKIGRDGRMKAGAQSFVFNPDLLPMIQTLRKMNKKGA